MPKEIEDVLLSNSSFQLCLGKIALDDLRRFSHSFNKNNRKRAAAKCFNSECAAAREKIEDARPHHGVAQTGKDSSFDTIHRWSDTLLRNCQADSAGAAG